MVKINFGVSSFSRCCPGTSWEKRVKEIPETGELPNISTLLQAPHEIVRYLEPNDIIARKFSLPNYGDVRNNKYIELPAVRFPVVFVGSPCDMYLVWIEQRKEMGRFCT